MIHDLSYYKKIQGLHGTTSAKEAEIRRIKTDYKQEFDTWLDTENVSINGTNSQLLITKTSKDDVKKVSAKPDATLSLGDTVGWCGAYWLVDELDADNRIHNKGKMRRCNLLLKWKNESGTVISRYCVCGDASGLGLDEKPQITTVDGIIKIRIRTDEEVAKLKRGKRFLIDTVSFVTEMLESGSHPLAYKVTKRDSVTGLQGSSGFTELTLAEAEYSQDTDNPHLMIADYYTPTDTYTVSITNATSPLLLELEGTFQLEFSATKNGSAVNQTLVSFISSDESVATVSSTGLVTAVDTGSCVITARYEKATVQLTVNVAETASAAEIHILNPDGETAIVHGLSKTFGVEIFENGEPSEEEFTATISGVDGVTVTVVNGGVVVSVPDDEALIGEAFVLTVACSVLAVSTTLNLTVRGWFF
jgi:hypothetical protein